MPHGYLVVYIDDILMYSNGLEKHVFHMSSVLARLWEHSLYVKVKKCHFHLFSVSFVVFVITAEGVCIEVGKVQAMLGWPPPKMIKDLQRFPGFCQLLLKAVCIFHYTVLQITALMF